MRPPCLLIDHCHQCILHIVTPLRVVSPALCCRLVAVAQGAAAPRSAWPVGYGRVGDLVVPGAGSSTASRGGPRAAARAQLSQDTRQLRSRQHHCDRR